MLRDFMIGSVKIHILYHASEGPVYGTALMEELGRHGYRIGPGTLYPTLHAMERNGLLHSERQTIAGRVRRYYTITPQGLKALEEARHAVRELMHEIFKESSQQSQGR